MSCWTTFLIDYRCKWFCVSLQSKRSAKYHFLNNNFEWIDSVQHHKDSCYCFVRTILKLFWYIMFYKLITQVIYYTVEIPGVTNYYCHMSLSNSFMFSFCYHKWKRASKQFWEIFSVDENKQKVSWRDI